MKLYEIYANDELWDKTSCPFGTEVLNREAYDINRGELDIDELGMDLMIDKIPYNDSNNTLTVEMSWEGDQGTVGHGVEGLIYVYNNYIYYLRTAYNPDGCSGFTMTREPQFNKKHL